MKSRLNNLRVYLSGPCENAVKAGADWRSEITPKLKELGLVVFDPVHKPTKLSFCNSDGVEEFKLVKKLRDEGNYKELARCMKEVVHTDLRMTDSADLLIVLLDGSSTTGTIDEIVTACNQKKPVYLCATGGKKTIPLWLFGRVPESYIFEDLNEILARLDMIAFCGDNELPDFVDKRWLFLNNFEI